ncbi:hypothetical protein LZD49_19835 [Dyadobacter sp. CY261]|uniref:hypothetical protein n=1 Tax=Dyadobacter sp. CY261 TaxID=2907203 RepID=UPI001F45B23B|nr:hypothetical protein [Dyadobacter sp. CY261]MCF0072742.1 hypothetical protein [Dyadobacter sp. CY261]
MKPTHLTDTEIQLYALQSADSNPAALEHVRHCESCQARAREYTLLFHAVGQQTRPAFDFDLPEVVMGHLVQPKASPVGQLLIVSGISFLSAAFLGTMVFLFGQQLLDLFSNRSQVVLYTAMAFPGALTILLVIESYREFQGKMKQLNFN